MLSYIDVKLHSDNDATSSDVSLHRVATRKVLDIDPGTSGLGARVKELREAAGLKMNELDRMIGQGSGYTTRLESGEKKNPQLHVLDAYARELKVNIRWLVTGKGSRVPNTNLVPSPPAGVFIDAVDRLPGLRDWLTEYPLEMTIIELAKAMEIYETVKPTSRSDGQPMGGWTTFFSDALSGRLTRPHAGSQAEAEDLEMSQMSASARKRVRPAPK